MQCYYRFFNKTGLRELDNVHYSRMPIKILLITIHFYIIYVSSTEVVQSDTGRHTKSCDVFLKNVINFFF